MRDAVSLWVRRLSGRTSQGHRDARLRGQRVRTLSAAGGRAIQTRPRHRSDVLCTSATAASADNAAAQPNTSATAVPATSVTTGAIVTTAATIFAATSASSASANLFHHRGRGHRGVAGRVQHRSGDRVDGLHIGRRKQPATHRVCERIVPHRSRWRPLQLRRQGDGRLWRSTRGVLQLQRFESTLRDAQHDVQDWFRVHVLLLVPRVCAHQSVFSTILATSSASATSRSVTIAATHRNHEFTIHACV